MIFQAFNTLALPITASFDVLNSENQEIVYSGFLYKSVIRYGHAYMVGQFDTLSTLGNYFVRTNMNNEEIVSDTFKIDLNVYDKTLERVMRFFTYQRCNYAVPELVTGYPGHAACHLTDAEVWNGTSWIQHSLLGGWHDAGDYNKYDSRFQTNWHLVL